MGPDWRGQGEEQQEAGWVCGLGVRWVGDVGAEGCGLGHGVQNPAGVSGGNPGLRGRDTPWALLSGQEQNLLDTPRTGVLKKMRGTHDFACIRWEPYPLPHLQLRKRPSPGLRRPSLSPGPGQGEGERPSMGGFPAHLPAVTAASHLPAKSGSPGGSRQFPPDPWEGLCEEQLPHSTATAWVGRGWFIVWVDWWLRHVGIFCATLGAWWPLRNGSVGAGPTAAPSAHLGPREEGRDVPHRHIPGQRFHTQVPVIGQQHHLPQQPDWLLCWQREQRDFTEGRGSGPGALCPPGGKAVLGPRGQPFSGPAAGPFPRPRHGRPSALGPRLQHRPLPPHALRAVRPPQPLRTPLLRTRSRGRRSSPPDRMASPGLTMLFSCPRPRPRGQQVDALGIQR